jgi:hypothetical protein
MKAAFLIEFEAAEADIIAFRDRIYQELPNAELTLFVDDDATKVSTMVNAFAFGPDE